MKPSRFTICALRHRDWSGPSAPITRAFTEILIIAVPEYCLILTTDFESGEGLSERPGASLKVRIDGLSLFLLGIHAFNHLGNVEDGSLHICSLSE